MTRRIMGAALAAAVLAGLGGMADARPIHYRALNPAMSSVQGSNVMHDVLVANPYGDVVVTGKTGFHRSDFGVMVPDSEPQSVVATGRASGSGLGANGLPGINFQ